METNIKFPDVHSTGDYHVCKLGYDDWVHLDEGDRVLVQVPGSPLQNATVDDIGDDASYFWLWIDGYGRKMTFDGDSSTIFKLTEAPR
ncbi:hypothetical protein [Arthrobacter sp. ISL-95]|uniref:hypothetical protein n=1 Tax=Arthrobacter sp. ISL-95 TaxID=2819116 RepID=UPI001BED0364|nr:hypothetical protein [Arthrobacter sp. ISL-95]MBT2585358.1 hypothetical protein [Arthrobacter sp. ISL-95]